MGMTYFKVLSQY